MKKIVLLCLLLHRAVSSYSQPIDRHAVTQRHDVLLSSPDTLGSLSVGNGHFCFTADITGLQSFPVDYQNGVPLGTESDWGWHSFPNDSAYRLDETFKPEQAYAVEWRKAGRNHDAAEYLRQNPHRLQLGNLGMLLYKRDGSAACLADLKDIRQRLDLWKGEIISHFTLEGEAVDVVTCVDPEQDAVSSRIQSSLIREHRLMIFLRFPYPSGKWGDDGTSYGYERRHRSLILSERSGGAVISHTLDTTTYFVGLKYTGGQLLKSSEHLFRIEPTDDKFELTVGFTSLKPLSAPPSFIAIRESSIQAWKKFWLSGGAIDFAGSTDPRASELERRVVLSEYLTRIQSVGDTPPQETGLTYNSWYGRPHMEMVGWHTAQFALWGRAELLEKNMRWYFRVTAGARGIAARQGYNGLRWQKMTDPRGGEAPSSVGSFLVWQQPHLIYLAEMLYRAHPSVAVLKKYKDLVFATASFMASFPRYDSVRDCYTIGPPLIPAQECFNSSTTYNPTYELAYWYWALEAAQRWRQRLGLPPDKRWERIKNKLAPLPQKDGVYLATESTPDCYAENSKYTIDHPAVLAALCWIPAVHGLDIAVMKRTYRLVDSIWHWEHTWGWDFPMAAMTATRLGQPGDAVDALFKNVHSNTWLPNGHNYQDGRLRLYLPGNGGLLAAIALMCAGYDGCKQANPGFPADGSWKVRWEGLSPLP